MPFKSYREESKTNWGAEIEGVLSRDQIGLGAILRIADAVESMAGNYRQLQRERDDFKRYWDAAELRVADKRATISALRGVITKLRRKGGVM